MARRRISRHDGLGALKVWSESDQVVPAKITAMAVRFTLEELSERAPGGAVEIRVPPFGVGQAIEGTKHTRGTPPAVVETDPTTWLNLATGRLEWSDAVQQNQVTASGERTNLAELLPLFGD